MNETLLPRSKVSKANVAQSEEIDIETIAEETMSEVSEEITSEVIEKNMSEANEETIMSQIIVRIISVARDTTVRIEVGLPIIAKKDTKTIRIRNPPKVIPIEIMTITIIVTQINFLIVVQ